VNTVMNLQIP